MKIKNILMLIVLSLALVPAINAQGRGKGGFDIERIKQEKAEFLIRELGLTDSEAKAFLPLEAEFMHKKFDLNRAARHETRTIRQKVNKTDADFKKITEVNLDTEAKETALQKEYFQKFSKVLSAEKVEKYRRADIKFMEILLKRRKQDGRN